MTESKFKIRHHVRILGVTALRGQTGIVRGVRWGDPYAYFVYLDKRHWPAIPENGIWVREDHLEHTEDEADAVREAVRHLRTSGEPR